ncbi:MAG: acetylornithine deacetylase [Gammaproteobacteria bacterium SG8_11]|nr:MAG: acetylornithine deacetylase [Gammaproteobacteria bacterium SG8_11]
MSLTHPSLTEMLGKLIAAPSISSVSPEFDQSNRNVIDLLAYWLEGLGYAVEILPLPHQPHKANLIATLGQGPGGLVLAGHTDTVPFDHQQWKFDPFKLTEAENRFYGLGIADMKNFFALAIEAACSFEAKDFQQPLILLATADEESSMDGAKALVDLGRPKARYAVIGEPTGMKPVHLHKGIIMEAVHIHGHAGHSSNPALGANALEGLHQVLGLLLNWRDELQRKNVDRRFEVPVPTLNLGLVAGGDNPNRICAHSQVHFDLRMLPGMHMNLLRQELDKRLADLGSHSALKFSRESLCDGTAPLHTPADSQLVETLEKLTGHGSEAVAFCTEGPYLNSLGMDTVILGPGDIAQAHQPDEYLALERINPTLEVLKALIHKFCVANA